MSKESVTVAGIDCGTNSIRLKVARVDADGMHEVVPRILRVIRLGQDVDKTHRFADEALERAYEAAREFAGVLAEHPVDGLRFVATSATRDAENREEFEDGIESILGVRPEVIPGTEEADLSFLGATSVVNRDDLPAPYLVVDLGGGSTELVIGGDGVNAPTTQVQGAFSMNIGSVRMTERHLRNDPPTEAQIDEAIQDIDEHIDEAFRTVPAGKARAVNVLAFIAALYSLYSLFTAGEQAMMGGALVTFFGWTLFGVLAPRLLDGGKGDDAKAHEEIEQAKQTNSGLNPASA